MNQYKCHFCPKCDGMGCISELPGMGGIRKNINFQLNCSDWDTYPKNQDDISSQPLLPIRLGPITGSVENIGYENEAAYYFDMIEACVAADIRLSIGDGCPDEKIQSGIMAVEKATRKALDEKKKPPKAAVFVKPYQNTYIFERIEWSKSIAEYVGIDIDSYNIVTMHNLVNLEKKTAKQLLEIKRNLQVPFMIKGVFSQKDVQLVQEVKPDIIVISNHGGRVENRTGSTCDFLAENSTILKNHCGEIWVDGGIRKKRDIQVAAYFGAKEVMIARPFISALCKSGKSGLINAKKIIEN